MTTEQPLMDLALQPRALFSVPDAADLRIRCRSGTVWITLDHDPRDIVLEAGDSFTGDSHRRAVVYAMDRACIAISRPHAPALPRKAAGAAPVLQLQVPAWAC